MLSNMRNLRSNDDAEYLGGSVNGDSLNSPGTLKQDGDDHSNLNKTEEELEREVRFRKESEAVDKARLMCIMVYLTSALAVSIAVFLVALKNEQATFVSEYEKYVRDITTMVTGELANNFGLIAQLSASITSAARLSNSRFPYFTNSEFEISGGYLEGMSGIYSVAFAPLVPVENQTAWERYSVNNQNWLLEGALLRQVHPGHIDPMHGTFQGDQHRDLQISDVQDVFAEAFKFSEISQTVYSMQDGEKVPYQGAHAETLAPVWQVAPTPYNNPKMVNYNLLSDPVVSDLFDVIKKQPETVMSEAFEVDYLFDHVFNDDEKQLKKTPHMYIAEPVLESFEPSAQIVGFLLALTSWESLFNKLLPEKAKSIHCVVTSSCGEVFTFALQGPTAVYLGPGDLHEPAFKFFVRNFHLQEYRERVCIHEIAIYPTIELRTSYTTEKPKQYTAIIVLAFIVTGILFIVYDVLVTSRSERAVADAQRTSAIVSSLFPVNVRDRLFEAPLEESKIKKTGSDFFDNEALVNDTANRKSKPIADLFPDVTVMFADIAGFTAWSSAREPVQVFQLLETLYSAFDETAKYRRVFKVETVGDCYVAACGLPNPRKDHAHVMALFARDCVKKTNELTRKLERILGPETSDLAMRVGLHSGPVTAGVLRGENARFQLFGDTMNTASRIENSGKPNQIHCSQEFADLLTNAGKRHWLEKREDTVVAKGKGALQTFWLTFGRGAVDDATTLSFDNTTTINEVSAIHPKLSLKTERLIEWNATVLLQKLRALVQQRNEGEPESCHTFVTPEAEKQTTLFVTEIAHRYHQNPFHNFEHASHVTMSVAKLLTRVVSLEDGAGYTRGIAANAMIQLGVCFSAIIHDVDHLGVPNTQLAQERPDCAAKYEHRSIAENNSITIAWELFLRPEFQAFRDCVAPTPSDLQAFHDTVVHATLATDIVDKELKADRNARWEYAFRNDAGERGNELKVRIVLEHLIQASDVSHTMQHWHIYRKWNERLFEEMYKAYREGRAAHDPSEFWYQGEIGFFDFYIIPLAKKLADCGVFGVSSDEYHNYAQKNRMEWQRKGREIVASMLEKYQVQYDKGDVDGDGIEMVAETFEC